MAVPAEIEPQRSNSGAKKVSEIEYLAIRLYAGGKTRGQVADLLVERTRGKWNRKYWLRNLRRWEETQWFRDKVYDYSIQEVDMAIPRILNGVVRRAQRGRTDSARLALEVTGRHNPRGESGAPSTIHINLGGGMPRPANRPQLNSDQLDGEVVAEEEDLSE